MARTDIEISPWPVRRMIGSVASVLTSSRWRSRPLSPGRRTSRPGQPGASRREVLRHAWAVGETMGLWRESRTDRSSSTT